VLVDLSVGCHTSIRKKERKPMRCFPPRQILREKQQHGRLLWLLAAVLGLCMLLQPALSARAASLGTIAQNPDTRARAIVQQMTLDEKILELNGVIGTAVQEAPVQDYDGLLRIAPAWPSGWDVSGTVYIQGNSKVDVQVEGGQLTTVAIEAGSSGTIAIRNPWSGQKVEVVDNNGIPVVSPTTASQFNISVLAGHAYFVEPVANPTASLPFSVVIDQPANAVRSPGARTIGL
jgi:hypothetical protein